MYPGACDIAGKQRKGPRCHGRVATASLWGRSQVEIRKLCAHRLAYQVADSVGDVSVGAAGLVSVFLRHEMAKVGQAGGNGKPDAVHQGGDGG